MAKGERKDELLEVTLGGAYTVRSRIGTGGMGSVYLAEHVRLPKSFAVKVLNDSVDPGSELYHRFRREAEVCSRLKHEHIVEVVDFNITESGRPYIVMELLEGEDLATRLERQGPFSLEQTARILGQVASALGEAHEQGVVHRDMKPQNIFLCRRRHQDDYVKLVDFGISKIQGAGSVLTQTNSLMGTPFYMSPEQTGAGDGKVDHRTDIYALGVIAYQMLTGDVPFRG
ncbi:MAG: serine/threonine-protein kinase, partial [Polyangia bacterium]|nr:serine/threonine-protein kinase [Polyangia bacterium]